MLSFSSSFDVIFNQPRSRTTFISIFVVLCPFVNFFKYNCKNLLFVILFWRPLEMFISLQLSLSLQFRVYFVCWRISKIVCRKSTRDFGKSLYETLDKSWSDIWSHRSEYHWKDWVFNNDKENNILISSNATHTPLKSTLTILHWTVHFFLIVYRPVPRRLKRPTVYRCHNKVSSFSPVLSRPWVLVRLGSYR